MNYQVTGNEYISLPTIRESDGAVENISCLYMTLKGMIELKGRDGLLRPFLKCDGKEIRFTPGWSRDHYWIPSFVSETEELLIRCIYLTPVGEKGFVLRLEIHNISDTVREVLAGIQGSWDETLHTVNESISITEGKTVKQSGWNNMFVFQQIPGVPLIAFAPVVSDNQPFSHTNQGIEWKQNGFSYSLYKSMHLQPDEETKLDFFFGLGYEEVAASAGAKEMLRQGFDALKDRTITWLAAREKHPKNEKIRTILNTNLFFAFFYASGRTLDTEELCMMTSRSPRYYVSAAYWDRDSLLWAYPAIVETDPVYAKELLLSIYSRQGRNFGIHSRYIDGTILEPGFEMDELCAPVIALNRYIKKVQDTSILKYPAVTDALESILQKLEQRKHPSCDLYETFLQPSDDMHHYPYLTYDNMLVWKTLHILSDLLGRPSLAEQAEIVKAAILKHCVFEHNGKPVFAWSVDLKGNRDIYDEPPGSLQLFPFYGFCTEDDDIWQNTMFMIRDKSYPLSFADHPIAEIGCQHAPHPWILSICNSLLAGFHEKALIHLQATAMDNGIACESVDEDTGVCTTGSAFATCAGFLAYALSRISDQT